MIQRRAGFTLIEILTVVGIIGVLAAIAFPVTARVRESARSAGCLSNLRQLGLAIHLYAGDADDRAPGPSEFGLGGHTIPLGFGWAGKVFPYAKAGVFACGTDDSRFDPRTGAPGASLLSYGVNDNLTALDLSQAASASRTVLLFEVTNDHARVDRPDEGAGDRPGVYTQRSAAGNGVRGSLLDASMGWKGRDPSNEVAAHYATGYLDNDEDASLADTLQPEEGRHRGGANYLALDGHAVWSAPKAVSAGSTAHSSGAAQSAEGCSMLPVGHSTADPCAAGTGDAAHRLTFSAQ